MKQREKDFLAWKLYLFWIYINYLLTFDQQLREHLFQVLQEKKIIFRSVVELHTCWQGMTISQLSHYVLTSDEQASLIYCYSQSKSNSHIKWSATSGSALSDFGLHQLWQRKVKRNPAEGNYRETFHEGLQSSPF